MRAINNYSLKTGKCDLQLLGPIIADTFSSLEPAPEPPSTSSYAEVSWSFTESGGANGNFRVYDNGSNIATLTANGSGNQRIDTGHIVNAEMYPVSWVAGVSMSINVNGATTIATSSSIDNTISSSFTATSGSVYYITGSINDSNAPCCSPQITGFAINGSNLEISFSTGSTCAACSNTTVQSSVDNSTWGGSNTGACVSPRSITAPTSSLYYRVNMDCGFASTNGSSSYYNFSNGITKTTTTGTYVVSGGNSYAAGQLTNNTGVTLYIYGYFISGGDTTGDVSSDAGSVSTTNLTFTGTISGSGQQIYSTNYHTLSSNNTPVSWSLSKQDGLIYNVRVKAFNTLGVSSTYTSATRTIVGGLLPPANVEDFSCNIIGRDAHLSWTQIPDLDLAYYAIRFSTLTTGAEWQNSVSLVEKVARPATSVTVPARIGSYLYTTISGGSYRSIEGVSLIDGIAGLSGVPEEAKGCGFVFVINYLLAKVVK